MNFTNKIEEKMNEYLESANVTIQEVLGDTDAFVFGGALRDSIADVEINDIDIIGFSMSANDIRRYLKNENFEMEQNEEFEEFYKDMRLFTVSTYLKEGCKIQLMQLYPEHNLTKRMFISDRIPKAIHRVVKAVDIDICALSYNPNVGLKEDLPDVIQHIEDRVFEVFEDNIMHQENRIDNRIAKMIKKGFIPLNTKPIPNRYNAWED